MKDIVEEIKNLMAEISVALSDYKEDDFDATINYIQQRIDIIKKLKEEMDINDYKKIDKRKLEEIEKLSKQICQKYDNIIQVKENELKKIESELRDITNKKNLANYLAR